MYRGEGGWWGSLRTFLLENRFGTLDVVLNVKGTTKCSEGLPGFFYPAARRCWW